jgi:hypothetical protein
MGWFFGLKLHLVINHKGQVMALKITPGNTADSTVLDQITQHLSGKICADKVISAASCSANFGSVAYISSPASGATCETI